MTQIGPWSEESPPTPAQMWRLRVELMRRRVQRRIGEYERLKRAQELETPQEREARERAFCEEMIERFRKTGRV